jgi:hypothetical protein
MKLTIEVDCTPDEARAFLGLPDVRPLNEELVGQLRERLTANLASLSADELLKNWLTLGTGAQEQFRRFMGAMSDIAKRPGTTSG